MFHATIYENSQPAGMGVLEIVPGEPRAGEAEHVQGFVPLQQSELRGDIVGPLADLRLLQTFGYARTICAQTLEAIYRFPLPGDAAVTQVTVRFGEVEIVATLQARADAEAEYEAAKQAGRQAALATREAPDVFTLQLAGLQPDQLITVETRYLQLARSEGSRWSVRVPLTPAPRYTRQDEQGTRPASGHPLALVRDPGHRFRLAVQLHQASAITSPTHALTITANAESTTVTLQAGETIPDRDFVLQWSGPQAESQPQLTLFAERAADDPSLYFLAQLSPPRQTSQTPLPREIILLVDHSGSMSGPKWAAADWAVERFLGDLQPTDQMALGIFHNTTHWFAQKLQSATPERVAKAITWLKQNTDSGGTELGVALEQALRLPPIAGEAARHLLILTDAAVTDGDRILRLADQARAATPRRRINVICIDAAPNAFLAQELAQRGGGVAKFLTSDPHQQDITTALDEVLAAWAEPLAVNLQLEIGHPAAEVADQPRVLKRTTQTTVVDLGDLMGGQTLWLTGRVPNHDTATPIQVALKQADGRILAAQPMPVPQPTVATNLRALFGARRVQGLEYLVNAGLPPEQVAAQLAQLGYDPAQVLGDQAQQPPAIYAENARQQLASALRRLLVQEALRYGLASTETAFVATRQEAGQPVQTQVAVANALPAGWSEGFVTRSLPPGVMSMARSLGVMPAAQPSPAMHLPTGLGKRSVAQSMPASAPPGAGRLPRAAGAGQTRGELVVFRGEVRNAQPDILLYPTDQAASLAETLTLTGLELRLLTPSGAPSTLPPQQLQQLDRKVVIQLFIGDLASPRAQIRLHDLLRAGGRPLNLARAADQPFQVRLADPAGWLQQHPLHFELVVRW